MRALEEGKGIPLTECVLPSTGAAPIAWQGPLLCPGGLPIKLFQQSIPVGRRPPCHFRKTAPTSFTPCTSYPPHKRWALHVRGEGAGGFPTGVHWLGLRTPYTANLTSAVKAGLRRSLFDQRRAGAEQFVLRLPDDAEPGSNVYVLQVQTWLPASLDLVFTSGRGAGERARVAALTGAAFNAQLARHSAAFNARLARTFPVEEGRGGVPTGRWSCWDGGPRGSASWLVGPSDERRACVSCGPLPRCARPRPMHRAAVPRQPLPSRPLPS